MTDTRKVIVNGTEYEVELEGEGTQWKATVGGQTFDIEMPEDGGRQASSLRWPEKEKIRDGLCQHSRKSGHGRGGGRTIGG